MDGILHNHTFDGCAYNYYRFEALTKTHSSTVFDLEYTDNAAHPADTEIALHHNMSIISDVYRSIGFIINTHKTEIYCRSAVPHTPGREVSYHADMWISCGLIAFLCCCSTLSAFLSLDYEIHCI